MNFVALMAAFLASANLFAASIYFTVEMNQMGGGRVYLPCVYSDRFTAQCLFDSGSDNTSVGFNSFTQNLPSVGKTHFAGAAGKAKECDVVQIDSLAIGEFQKNAVLASRCADSVPADVVGINVLEGESFVFDFSERRIQTEVQIPSQIRAQELKVLPAGHLVVPIRVAGQMMGAVWDTGASLSAVDQEFVKEFPHAFTFVGEVSGGDVTGIPLRMKMYKTAAIEAAGIRLPESYVLALDFSAFRGTYFGDEVKMILGLNHMQSQKWYFDLPAQLWAIE